MEVVLYECKVKVYLSLVIRYWNASISSFHVGCQFHFTAREIEDPSWSPIDQQNTHHENSLGFLLHFMKHLLANDILEVVVFENDLLRKAVDRISLAATLATQISYLFVFLADWVVQKLS